MEKCLVNFALIGGAIALLNLSTQATAKDAEVLTLEPTTPWNVNYGDASCSLRRNYGSGEFTLVSQFEIRGPVGFLDVSLASRELKTQLGEVSYRFEPDNTFHKPPVATKVNFGDGLEGVRFTASLVSASSRQGAQDDEPVQPTQEDRQEREAGIHGLTVKGAFKRTVFIRTGPVDDAMGVMRACMDDLLASWGFDPSLDDSVAIPPSRIDPVGLAVRVMQAYPRRLRRSGISAKESVLVSVDATGRLTKCHAHNPEPHPEFEKAACDTLLDHARYEPARDADGNPVESFDGFTLIFEAT